MTVTPSRKLSLGNSNFVQHLRSKTASATPSPTKADRIVSKNPPPPVYVEEMSPETNGYFKVSVALFVVQCTQCRVQPVTYVTIFFLFYL